MLSTFWGESRKSVNSLVHTTVLFEVFKHGLVSVCVYIERNLDRVKNIEYLICFLRCAVLFAKNHALVPMFYGFMDFITDNIKSFVLYVSICNLMLSYEHIQIH